MPDWSYRTVLRPMLLAIGAERARRLAVRTLSVVGRVPQVIDFMGHMRADARLRTHVRNIELPGPIALGALIDPAGDALDAFARFGAGLIEVGPVVVQSEAKIDPRWNVDLQRKTIEARQPLTVDLESVARNLERMHSKIPVCVRIARQHSSAVRQIVERLQGRAAMFVVDASNVSDALTDRPVLVADRYDPHSDGVWMRGGAAAVRTTRASMPPDAILVAAGVGEPQDARDRLDAGANVAVVDEGLVCSGPGLVKRCNEALLSSMKVEADPEPLTLDAARRSWFWALLMGASMFAGGLLAVVIASTRVVLPYDEAMCGLTRTQMSAVNPRLLPFMAHDRVSLAGSMVSIGIFYVALAWFGIRRGSHWAQVTVILSAGAGALSFFSFLGFGYFDPFHAFVTAVLTQFLVLTMAMSPSPPQPPAADWRETPAWRRAQWGQLLFVVLGIGLTGAGTVMTVIGCTSVFVETDLTFMRTTAAALRSSFETLVPLVAHDRASLGGMLIANGIAVLLSALWGFRRDSSWLWWMLALGGNVAFGCAVVVHFSVGYDEVLHLAPAILGWVLWDVALVLTRTWMCAGEKVHDASLAPHPDPLPASGERGLE